MTTQDRQPGNPLDKQPANPLDQASQPGGVYVKDGQVVDAEGKVLEGWTVDDNGQPVKPGGSTPTSQSPSQPKSE